MRNEVSILEPSKKTIFISAQKEIILMILPIKEMSKDKHKYNVVNMDNKNNQHGY